jgi:ferredoxin
MLRRNIKNDEPESRATAVVDRNRCGYCGACVAVCQENAIFLFDAYLHIDAGACTACERCLKVCPVHALSVSVANTVPVSEVLDEVRV